jgi:hypothetical protein
MARIRTIKPAFWGDDKVSLLSRDARLLFVGLISVADDDGRFLASHAAIAGYVFPNDEDVTPKRLAAWLDEIAALKLVILYTCGHIRYGVIPKYRRHQRINRATPSVLPEPPTDTLFED